MLGKFDYLAPQSIDEAISYLNKYHGKIRILAGGTDILNLIRRRGISPDYLLSLKKISSLNNISSDKKEKILKIGSMTPLSTIASSLAMIKGFEILAESADMVGSVQIRNRGTIGGNICNASPAGDTLPSLFVLQSRLKIAGIGKTKIVPIEEFFAGPGKTILKDNEILTEVQIPIPADNSAGAYLKQGIRRAMDIAVVGVAVFIVFNSHNKELCEDIRIALGAVAPTPIRALKAEKILKGEVLKDGLVEEAAKKASDEINPISDIRASAEYRKEIVRVLTERAICQAIKNRR